MRLTANKLKTGETLQGLPGCPGSAEGRARVILDSSDPMALEPGDILFTGTPGIPPAAKPGDFVEVEVAGVGVLRNRAIARS